MAHLARASLILALTLTLSAAAVAPAGSLLRSPATPRWVTAAIEQLARIPTKPLGPSIRNPRSQFGSGWADLDHNCRNTRDEILRRDLTQVVYVTEKECQVESGVLVKDPYTGETISFVRGRRNLPNIDIDHIVALGNAWRTGAAGWSNSERVALANDPAELLAVDASANRSKKNQDASTWVPKSAYVCRYVAKQIAIKASYGLWVTPDERRSMKSRLATC